MGLQKWSNLTTQNEKAYIYVISYARASVNLCTLHAISAAANSERVPRMKISANKFDHRTHRNLHAIKDDSTDRH
jgi:hypothetical protein